jgi:hypothetical protein
MKLVYFTSRHPQNVINLAERTVAIHDEVSVRSFSYISVTVTGRAHFCSTFDMVEQGIHFGYCTHTVAFGVW